MTPTLVALLVMSATVAAAQPQTATPSRDGALQNGSAIVRGRVLDDKGTPVRRAIVSDSAPALRLTRFVLSGADGRYELKNLPAGSYTIEAWHERLGVQSQKITIGEKETKDVSFTYKPAAS